MLFNQLQNILGRGHVISRGYQQRVENVARPAGLHQASCVPT
ncbi:hypothetical protein ANDA3_2320 [plant metagenome]|uniref:Uncharacterized protein n=2 Tax=root TaxID=1 RepID=A0A1C3JWY5_9BURK|nr:hypothetical protein ODI_01164 [Orrella dioscoreae]SOE49737.1 hypothetical protein ODI_R2280 [Orrella dioscoreae]